MLVNKSCAEKRSMIASEELSQKKMKMFYLKHFFRYLTVQ